MAKKKSPTPKMKVEKLNTKWIENALKSIGVSGKNYISKVSPNIMEVTDTGLGITRTLATTLRRNKDTNVVTNALANNKYVKLLDSAFKNSIRDIKTGDFHGIAQQNSEFTFGEENFGSQDENAPLEINTSNLESGIATLSTQMRSTAMANIEVQKASAKATVAMNASMMQLNNKLGTQIINELTNVNNNLSAIIEFQNNTISNYIKASTAYMDSVGKTSGQNRESSDKDIKISDLLNPTHGGINLNQYKKYVKQQALKDPSVGHIAMILQSEELLKQIIQNPVGAIMDEVVEKAMPKVISTSLKGLETAFNNFLPTFLTDISDLKNNKEDTFSGAIKRFIGATFGIRVEDNDKLSRPKVNRNAATFDGDTRTAIIKVIPKYLSDQTAYLKILAEKADSKTNEKFEGYHDYWSPVANKFLTKEEIDKQIIDVINSNMLAANAANPIGEALETGRSSIKIYDNKGNVDREKTNAKREEYNEAVYNFLAKLAQGDVDRNGIIDPKFVYSLMQDYIANAKKDTPEALIAKTFGNEENMKKIAASAGTISINNKSMKNQLAVDLSNDSYGYNLDASSFNEGDSIQDIINKANKARREARKKNSSFANEIDSVSRFMASPNSNPNLNGNIESPNSIVAGISNSIQGLTNSINNAFMGKGTISDNLSNWISTQINKGTDFLLGKKNGDENEGGILTPLIDSFKDTGSSIKHGLMRIVFGKNYNEETGEYEENGDGLAAKFANGFNGWLKIFFGADEKTQQKWDNESLVDLIQLSDTDRGLRKMGLDPEKVKAGAKGEIIGFGTSLLSGGVLGSIIGGPLTGALIGGIAGIASKSERFQTWLFGEDDGYGNKVNGFISDSTQKFFKKNKNDIAATSFIGSIAGTLTGGGVLGTLVGGPIAGALMGAGAGIIAKSDTFQTWLFGEMDPETNERKNNGIVNSIKTLFTGKEDSERNPAMSVIGAGLGAAIGKMGLLPALSGPFGPIVGAIAGLGLSIKAQGSNFKEWLFGKEDGLDVGDGTKVRKQGVLGQFFNYVTAGILNPIKTEATYIAKASLSTIKEGILGPTGFVATMLATHLGQFFDALGENISGIISSAKGIAKHVYEETFGRVVQSVTDAVVNVAHFAFNGVRGLTLLPGKLIEFGARVFSEIPVIKHIPSIINTGFSLVLGSLKTTGELALDIIKNATVGVFKLISAPFRVLGQGAKKGAEWLGSKIDDSVVGRMKSRAANSNGTLGKLLRNSAEAREDYINAKKERKENRRHDKNARLIARATKGQFNEDTETAREYLRNHGGYRILSKLDGDARLSQSEKNQNDIAKNTESIESDVGDIKETTSTIATLFKKIIDNSNILQTIAGTASEFAEDTKQSVGKFTGKIATKYNKFHNAVENSKSDIRSKKANKEGRKRNKQCRDMRDLLRERVKDNESLSEGQKKVIFDTINKIDYNNCSVDDFTTLVNLMKEYDHTSGGFGHKFKTGKAVRRIIPKKTLPRFARKFGGFGEDDLLNKPISEMTDDEKKKAEEYLDRKADARPTDSKAEAKDKAKTAKELQDEHKEEKEKKSAKERALELAKNVAHIGVNVAKQASEFSWAFGKAGLITTTAILGFTWLKKHMPNLFELIKNGITGLVNNLPAIISTIGSGINALASKVNEGIEWVTEKGKPIFDKIEQVMDYFLKKKKNDDEYDKKNKEAEESGGILVDDSTGQIFVQDSGLNGLTYSENDPDVRKKKAFTKAALKYGVTSQARFLAGAGLNQYGSGVQKAISTSKTVKLKIGGFEKEVTTNKRTIRNLLNKSRNKSIKAGEVAAKTEVGQKVVTAVEQVDGALYKKFGIRIQEKIAPRLNKLLGSLSKDGVLAEKLAARMANISLSGLVSVFFIVEGFTSGISDTAKIFHVREDDVDMLMMSITSVIGAFKGTMIGSVLDLVLELAGVDLWQIIATAVYTSLSKKNTDQLLEYQKKYDAAFKSSQETDLKTSYFAAIKKKQYDGTYQDFIKDYNAGNINNLVYARSSETFSKDDGSKSIGTLSLGGLRHSYANKRSAISIAANKYLGQRAGFQYYDPESGYFYEKDAVTGEFYEFDEKGQSIRTLSEDMLPETAVDTISYGGMKSFMDQWGKNSLTSYDKWRKGVRTVSTLGMSLLVEKAMQRGSNVSAEEFKINYNKKVKKDNKAKREQQLAARGAIGSKGSDATKSSFKSLHMNDIVPLQDNPDDVIYYYPDSFNGAEPEYFYYNAADKKFVKYNALGETVIEDPSYNAKLFNEASDGTLEKIPKEDFVKLVEEFNKHRLYLKRQRQISNQELKKHKQTIKNYKKLNLSDTELDNVKNYEKYKKEAKDAQKAYKIAHKKYLEKYKSTDIDELDDAINNTKEKIEFLQSSNASGYTGDDINNLKIELAEFQKRKAELLMERDQAKAEALNLKQIAKKKKEKFDSINNKNTLANKEAFEEYEDAKKEYKFKKALKRRTNRDAKIKQRFDRNEKNAEASFTKLASLEKQLDVLKSNMSSASNVKEYTEKYKEYSELKNSIIEQYGSTDAYEKYKNGEFNTIIGNLSEAAINKKIEKVDNLTKEISRITTTIKNNDNLSDEAKSKLAKRQSNLAKKKNAIYSKFGGYDTFIKYKDLEEKKDQKAAEKEVQETVKEKQKERRAYLADIKRNNKELYEMEKNHEYTTAKYMQAKMKYDAEHKEASKGETSNIVWYDATGCYYEKTKGTWKKYNMYGSYLTDIAEEDVTIMQERGQLFSMEKIKFDENNNVKTSLETNITGMNKLFSGSLDSIKKFFEENVVNNTESSSSSNSSSTTDSADQRPSYMGGNGDGSAKINRGGRGEIFNGGTYYSQNDSLWRNRAYNSSSDSASMGDAGCGPTAMAMAASDVTGQKVSPTSMASLAQSTGDRDSSGTNWNFISKAGSMYGMSPSQRISPSSDDIRSQLASGNPVVLSGRTGGYGNSPYTNAGHYVVAEGLDNNGNVIINDPRGKEYSGAFNLDDVASETGSSWSFGGFGKKRKNAKKKNKSTIAKKSRRRRNKRGSNTSSTKDWLSIVKACKKSIGSQKMGYSQSGYIDVTVNGKTLRTRRDCSGFVSVCVAFYTDSQCYGGILTSTHGMASGSFKDLLEKHGFTLYKFPGWDKVKAGDIFLNVQTHTEICAEDGTHRVYNCGGDDSCNNTGVTNSFTSTFEYIWRPNDPGNGDLELATDGSVSTSLDNTVSSSSEKPSMVDTLTTGFSNFFTKAVDTVLTGKKQTIDSSIWGDTTDSSLATTDTSTSTASVDVSSNSTKKNIWNTLRKNGFNSKGAAGVMGCWESESGNNPNRIEGDYISGYPGHEKVMKDVNSLDDYTQNFLWPNYDKYGTGYTKSGYLIDGKHYAPGLGLAQWTGGRTGALINFAKKEGTPFSDLGTQLKYFFKELSAKGDLQQRMNKASSPEDAATIFLDNFEMNTANWHATPDGQKHDRPRRANAKSLYSQYNNNPIKDDSVLNKKSNKKATKRAKKSGKGGYGDSNIAESNRFISNGGFGNKKKSKAKVTKSYKAITGKTNNINDYINVTANNATNDILMNGIQILASIANNTAQSSNKLDNLKSLKNIKKSGDTITNNYITNSTGKPIPVSTTSGISNTGISTSDSIAFEIAKGGY